MERKTMSTTGIILSIAGVIWMAGALAQFMAKNNVMACMYIAVGAMNIVTAALRFAGA
jgi:hypothetical protein